MTTISKRRLLIFLSVPFLLLIPLVAMQFSSAVKWTAGDFMVMGLLLLGVGMGIELVLLMIKEPRQRLIFLGLVLLGFFLLWAELAVGIFGTVLAGS